MTDPDFETELFSLYGEPSRDVPDGGVTERLLREIDREARLRRWALVSAVAVGAVISLATASTYAAPLSLRDALPIFRPRICTLVGCSSNRSASTRPPLRSAMRP